MIQYLEGLGSIMQTGAVLERNEVIKRYRSLKNFNQGILNLLCMTDFFMLFKKQNGEIVLL